MTRRNFTKKPVVRKDPVFEAGKQMLSRLNQGNEIGIPKDTAPGKFIERLTRGGKTGDPATDAFVRALTNPKKVTTKDVSTGKLMNKLKPKKSESVVSNELNASLMDTVFDKETSIRPKKGKGKHRGQTLQQDERSLLDGISEEGFIGPQEEQI